MLKAFKRNRCGPIGLDIGSEGIRMLQLVEADGRLSVLAAGRSHFSPGVMGPGIAPADRRNLMVQAMSELLKAGQFRGRDVVSCLRGSELAIKNVRLPHMSDEDLAKAALFECTERFEFPITSDRLHIINAGEIRQGNESRDEVILMAASEQTVDDHMTLLTQMKLEPVAIDAEPNALFRAFQRFLRRADDISAISVIVDVGLSFTKVIVARGRTILLVKTIDLAGQKFNETVAKELGLNYLEAVHLRRRGYEAKPADGANAGDQIQWSVYDAIRGQVEMLAHEISLCLRYCSVTFRGLRATQVTLTGGEAYDPALTKLLGEILDCECAVGEPLRGIELGEADLGSDRRSSLTEWSVALGLALRGMEAALTRKTEHERRKLSA